MRRILDYIWMAGCLIWIIYIAITNDTWWIRLIIGIFLAMWIPAFIINTIQFRRLKRKWKEEDEKRNRPN